MKKSSQGITLIALIITIVVMLILVVVSIRIALETGLFESAGKATKDWETTQDQEQQLAGGKVTIGGKDYSSIEDYLAGVEMHNWSRTGDTFTCSRCNETYTMGQTVAYTPDGNSSTKITSSKSGLDLYYTENGEYPDYTTNIAEDGSQTVIRQETKWIVLGVQDSDNDGKNETLLITTKEPVYANANEPLFFSGAAAYNNGPEELDRICRELYSNSIYGQARAIKIEDINNALNYTPAGGIYKSSDGDFLTTGNFTTKLKNLPTFDIIVETGTYTPDGTNTKEKLGEYVLNGYYYSCDYLSIEDALDNTKEITEIEKNTIFGKETDYEYWVASQCSYTYGDYVNFGLWSVDEGAVDDYAWIFDSEDGDMGEYSYNLRPVVEIKGTLDKYVDFEELFETAEKHPDQTETNDDIGIAEDGSIVNLDLWYYEIILNGSYPEGYKLGENTGSYAQEGYNGDIIDGKIQGEVPMYIKDENHYGFYPVTSMEGTFYCFNELTTAPAIPSTVTNMYYTFFGCTSLTEAPVIPSSVTNMDYTFWDCTSLTKAPAIPSSVTNMDYTFWDCTSLTKAPAIPSSVTDMDSTFYGCTSLTEAPAIPSSVTDMWQTFSGCTSLTEAPAIPNSVTGLYSTFSGCTSLTEAPEIPSSVTDMRYTFFGCTSLTEAPEIPSSVTDMRYTFNGCTSLTGTLTINANPTSYSYCLNGAATNEGCNLVLNGSSTKLNEILATKSDNSNISLGS